MIIDLPLETWADLLAFLSRRQLAKNVPEIGNRQFASFAQFALHQFSNITLGNVHIQSSLTGNGAAIIKAERILPLADVQMPENVKNFKEIRISYYDTSVYLFLRRFRFQELLTGVNLHFTKSNTIKEPATARILHLVGSVNSIVAHGYDEMDFLQSEYFGFAYKTLQTARVLSTCYNTENDWFYLWVRTPRDDQMPRILNLSGNMPFYARIAGFVEQVKKDFMEATEAVSFFMNLFWFEDERDVEGCVLDNKQTGERLVITAYNQDTDSFTITRHPIWANKEWIEAMGTQQPNGKEDRKILIEV